MPHPIDCAFGITLYAGYCDLNPNTPGYYMQHPEMAPQPTPALSVYQQEVYAKERARLDHEAALRNPH